MDAFFVAVEVLDAPHLRGLPVVVGGLGSRGVVAASSYEARAWGVHSAMPTAIARQRCPQAVFLPGRHHRYHEVSTQVHHILEEMSPLVEGIALDEAFLDVRGVRRLHGDGPTIARTLRRRIGDELGLSCSVGVAPRKLTAKLASEAAKPRASLEGTTPGPGVVVVTEETETAFLHAHPVGALWGVGPATRRRLDALGVRTVGDLAQLPEDTLVRALGAAAGRHLHALAWARDFRPVMPRATASSIGHEETYPRDLHDRRDLDRELLRLADAVAHRVRRAGLKGRTVQLKVRFGDFRTVTRSVTLGESPAEGLTLARTARALLDGVQIAAGVRLLGVSVSQLVDGSGATSHQLSLGEDPAPWGDATEVIDLIRDRFGADAIVPAALAQGPGSGTPGSRPGGIRVVRSGDQQWGPALPSADMGREVSGYHNSG
ncbi:MAG: DNA polymerase IV [Actinobacteria bacterium]|nr:DNA polymerase IV [Actinomycetota bacterium]